ncbi:MAG: radical SAM protein [Bacteroidales bacterium]|nr:radical SAM protein [Bacteroidales bacterium]
MTKEILCGKTVYDIHEMLRIHGYGVSHATQVANNLYKKRIPDIPLFRNIPGKLLRLLSSIADTGFSPPSRSEVSGDKTVKYLFTGEGGKQFETVYIPDKKRNTVCVSTQSGCRMGCPFCLTGRYGYHGDLSPGEIINQILSIPEAGRINRVVFMGMGEPMDNLGNVLKACRIITSEWGMALSPRDVTVSTVGITTGIIEFLEESDCNLTLSLYSPFAAERSRIIPAERKYPAREIIEILKHFPAGKKRRFSIAYVMIKDVSDTDSHLEELKKLLNGSDIRVNLLPYHTFSGDSANPSSEERMLHFRHSLVLSGISASIRRSRGADIGAACGLLASGLGREIN